MRVFPEIRSELDLFALYILIMYVFAPFAIQLLLGFMNLAALTSLNTLQSSYSPPAIAVSTAAAGMLVISKAKKFGYQFSLTASRKYWAIAAFFSLSAHLAHYSAHAIWLLPAHSNLLHGLPLSTAISLLFLTLLFAPVFEEFALRGLLFSWIERKHGPFWGTTLTTVVFLLLHFNIFGSIPEFASFLLFSIGLAVLRIWSKSLGPAMFMHAIYNLLTLTFYTI